MVSYSDGENLWKYADADFSIGDAHVPMAACIALHFMYLNKPVTCDDAKLFLPWQADKVIEILGPTPITHHIAKCSVCSDDVQTIRRLNLERRQLLKLGEVYAGDFLGNSKNCQPCRRDMQAVVNFDFSSTTNEALRHICFCKECRHILHEQRRNLLQALLNESSAEPSCSKAISPSDLFFYVIPCSLDLADGRDVVFDSEFALHLSRCHRCLGEILNLHETLFAIADRPDSGVVTCYTSEDKRRDLETDAN